MTRSRVSSIAKITRPGFSRVCLRKRLFARLEKGRAGRAVWVSGPPGAGKTILVSSYIEAKGLNCLWYRADGADADPATFFYYLSQAAAKAAPARKKPLPLFTPEYAHGIAVFSNRFFEELYSRLKPGTCIVIDNYNEVPLSCAFHEAVKEGLSVLPDSMSAVIISRGGAPPSFTRLLASGSMEVIGAEELVLTPDESRRIAEIKLGKKAAKKDSDALLATAGGWAAGLAIILEEERSGKGGLSGEDARGRVFGYFAAEFFNRMDERAKSLLLKTSILREFDSATAGRVSGIREAAQMLAELHRGNFFTERRLLSRPVYQYHPLFREFLLEQLENSYGEDGLRQLRMRAASVLEELRNSEEAIELLAAASEWDDLARVLKNCAGELIAQGRHRRLGHWLGSIPEWKLKTDPWLLYWSGAAGLPAAPIEARKRLAAAYRLFKGLKDIAGLYLTWSAIADTFYYEWKDFRPLDGWIRELDRLRKLYPSYPSREIEARVVSAMFGVLVFRQPENPHLPLWEERVREIIFKSAGSASNIFIGNNLVFYYLWTGAYAKARVVLENLSGPLETRGADLPSIMWCIVNALYNFHVSSYDEALSWVRKGLAASDESGIQLLKAKLFGLGSLSSLMGQRPLKEAEAFSRGMGEALDRSNSFDLIYYHQQASRIALSKKDLSGALENIRIASGYAEKLGAPFLEALTEVIFAYYLVEAGEAQEAKKRLAHVKRLAAETRSSLLEYISLVTGAQLLLDARKERECLKSLSRALALGKKNGLRFLTVNLPESSSRLLAVAVKNAVEPGFTAELIRSNSLVCPDPEIENWPWQLKVRALGHFEVWKDEQKIQFTRKAQQKPFELLKAVITLGCRAVGERAITDMLWPDAEGDAAHSAFATTLHRLRQLIGGEKVLELKNGKLTLDPKYCWIDAWALEAALKKAEASAKAGLPENALKHIDDALALYRGDFLEADADMPWTAQARERLKERVCKIILAASERLIASGKAREAAEYLQAGLEVDGCAEALCQKLLEIYKDGGRRLEALAIFEKLKTSLSAKLAAEPAPATRAIIDSLTGK
ncbi:HTH-type transcriptional regulator MalT [uncultured bacterium]|nr:HTH-type transcriptional regulator MalT [uncultured bacterium]